MEVRANRCAFSFLATVLGLGLIFGLGFCPNADAHSAQQILMPLNNEVDLLQRANKELNNQTEQYRLTLLRQHSYLVTCRNQGLQFAKSRVTAHLRQRTEVNELMKSGYDRLLVQDGKAWLPLYGWLDKNARNTRYQNEKAAIDAEQSKITRKEHPFFVPTLGWVTENALNKQIQQANLKASDLLKIRNRGDDKLHYPGLGWISRKDIIVRIQKARAKISEITGQINRGEYPVWLPNLGHITRKQLQGRIADVERRLKDIKGKFSRKEAAVARSPIGWINQKSLEERIAQNRKKNKTLNDAIRSGTYKGQTPTLGMVDSKQINAKRQEMLDKWQARDKLYKTGDYPAPVKGFGMLTRKQLESKLKQKGLTAAQQQNLQSGRLRIDNTHQVEWKMRGAYITLLQKYAGEASTAAIPEQAQINTEYELLNQIKLREFNQERMAHIKLLTDQRDFLQQSLALIPDKVPPKPK